MLTSSRRPDYEQMIETQGCRFNEGHPGWSPASVFFSNISVVADSVAPALSLSVETFAMIMTGPWPATNDLSYLKSLMCDWLYKSEIHLWNSWDNNGNMGDNYGLSNTIFRIKFLWSSFLSSWLSPLVPLLMIHIMWVSLNEISLSVTHQTQFIKRMPCHCWENAVGWPPWHFLIMASHPLTTV